MGPESSYRPPSERNTVDDESRSLDEVWFEKFREAKTFDVLSTLEAEPAALALQKEAFLDGTIRNPEVSYPKANLGRLLEDEQKLLALKSEILESETDPDIRQVYVWKINEAIALARMLQSTAELGELDNKAWRTEEDRDRQKNKLMRRFTRYSKFVFGKPSTETLAYAKAKYIDLAHQFESHEDQAISEAAQRTMERLDAISAQDSTISPLEPEVFSLLQTDTIERQGQLIDFESYEGRKGVKVTAPIFEAALEELGADAKDWRVIHDDPSKIVITVKQGAKKIYIPPKFALSEQRVKELIIHEVGTHVVRGINGQKTQLKLLSIGLDRYEAGEEGLAMAREQTVKDFGDETDYLGMDRHLAVALALGADGKDNDFRSIYEAMYDIALLNEVKAGKSPEKAAALAQKNAWIRTLRTLRGTDFRTPGACFTKDISYAEGSVSTWYAIGQAPELIKIMLTGKFDLANPRHVAIVMRFGGFSDVELEELESERPAETH
jgi:hypothetical protein